MIPSSVCAGSTHRLKKIYYMYRSFWFGWKCIDLADFQRWSSIKCPTCLLIANKVLKASFHFDYWTAILLFFLLCDWEIKEILGLLERRNLRSRVIYKAHGSWRIKLSLLSPLLPPLHPLLLPPPCQINEALTHFYLDKSLNDSSIPLYVPCPFLSFEFAIFLACVIQRLPDIISRHCKTWKNTDFLLNSY